MSNLGDQFSLYAAQTQVAYVRAGWLGAAVTAGWLAFPVAVAMVIHPSDAIKVGAFLQGLPRPQVFTMEQLAAGFIEAVIALAVLAAFQLGCTIGFYRRAQMLGLEKARTNERPIFVA
jgi:hypothetical protein